eukprot:1162092-Pelagomonas_calceolata.AAC.12
MLALSTHAYVCAMTSLKSYLYHGVTVDLPRNVPAPWFALKSCLYHGITVELPYNVPALQGCLCHGSFYHACTMKLLALNAPLSCLKLLALNAPSSRLHTEASRCSLPSLLPLCGCFIQQPRNVILASGFHQSSEIPNVTLASGIYLICYQPSVIKKFDDLGATLHVADAVLAIAGEQLGSELPQQALVLHTASTRHWCEGRCRCHGWRGFCESEQDGLDMKGIRPLVLAWSLWPSAAVSLHLVAS